MPPKPSEAAASKATRFAVQVPQAVLDRIHDRVRNFRWYPPPVGADGRFAGWRYGVDVEFLRSLAQYWTAQYDWRKTEQRINRIPNFRVEIDGLKLHYLLEKGSGNDPTPLLIIHGWPYSFLSYLGVIDRLSHPERFGGDPADAFDVVVVSVPGYGFSDSPRAITGLHVFGHLYHKLMTEVLGYSRYVLDGGDQGALSASWMALDYPAHVIGLHQSNVFPRHPEAPYGSGLVGPNPTQVELDFVKDEKERFERDSSYFLIHLQRPETLAVAMMDSPVGAAAWIAEKYHYWTDQQERPFDQVITQDRLLDEIMLYLVTDTFRTSLWPYTAFQTEVPILPADAKIMVPTGIAAWPDPLNPMPPREFVKRSRGNIVQWTDMPRGGHFPFYEEPELFAQDLISFGKKLRRG
jgi:microsomal epoxide hydrolase